MTNSNIILVENSSRYPLIEGIVIDNIYRPLPKFLRLIRYLHHRSGILPKLKRIWLGKWKKQLLKYNKITIFDSIFDYTPLIYIRKHRPDIEINFCFRNRVHESIEHSCKGRNPEEIKQMYGCQIWSYNKEDCNLYNLIFYNQFHLLQEETLCNYSNEICWDAYFIGKDKGRLKELKEIDKIIQKAGFTTKIEVVPTSGIRYSIEDNRFLIKSRPYNEVIQIIKKTRCIIDWVSDLNQGMTFRSLEAIVLKKKLITNYLDIQQADFYDPKNIFIVGYDPIEQLPFFLRESFNDSGANYIKKYSFKTFCSTIFHSSSIPHER